MSISHTNYLLLPPWFKELLFWCAKHVSLDLFFISDLLCFLCQDKSGFVNFVKRHMEFSSNKTVSCVSVQSIEDKSYDCKLEKLIRTYCTMCDRLNLLSVRFQSHSACSTASSYTQSPFDLQIIQSGAKRSILCLPIPRSCLLIVWCVLNGSSEQWRQQHDEWILSNIWHTRHQLIKATVQTHSRRSCTHCFRQGCPTWHKAQGYEQRHQLEM